MGLLTQKDVRIYRGWFKEMAKLRGIPVKYRYVTSADILLHAEIEPTLSDPINMDIIFETNPRTNTLKKIGWVSENPNDKPYIAMLPYDSPNLTVEARIEMDTIDAIPTSPTKIFRVTTINSLLEYPDCWVCTIAPVFQTEPPKLDYDQSNYNYITETKTEGTIQYPLVQVQYDYSLSMVIGTDDSFTVYLIDSTTGSPYKSKVGDSVCMAIKSPTGHQVINKIVPVEKEHVESAVFSFDKSDTVGFAPGVYSYDVMLKDISGNIIPIIPKSDFTFIEKLGELH